MSGSIAEYAVSFDLNTVPPEVVAYSKMLLLDLVGAALAGVTTDEGQAAVMTIKAILCIHTHVSLKIIKDAQ